MRLGIGMNVYDAAVKRLAELYEDGHRIVVCMSGGKDSGACLNLAIEAASMADRLPVEAVYREEEILYPGTREFVMRCHDRPEVDLHWLVAGQPMINLFSRRQPYWWICDDRLTPDQWVTQPPEYAEWIPQKHIEGIVSPDRFPPDEGKALIAVIRLRVSESTNRRMGLASSGGHLTGLEKRGGVPYRTVRPIYDWTDKDIWTAHRINKWDYNEAYDLLYKAGMPLKEMRIGPVTMNTAGIGALAFAASAWPRWFDRVCKRCPGVMQARHFGATLLKPDRYSHETWKDCYQRVCIDTAPDWIAERAAHVAAKAIEMVGRKGVKELPDVAGTNDLGAGNLLSWYKLAHVMFSGDPFALKTQQFGLKPIEPEFFREGAGTWGGGTPTW